MFSKLKDVAITTIIKGFKISIGWNLGRKKISSHLLDPFTSVPMKGTKIKEIKKIKKKRYDNKNNLFFSKIEKKKHCEYSNWNKYTVLKKKKIIICV